MSDKEKTFSSIEQVIDTYLPDYRGINKVEGVQLGRAFGDQLATDLLEDFRKDLKKMRQQGKENQIPTVVLAQM